MAQDTKSPSVGIASTASTISQKFAALKKAIEFDAGLKTQFSKARSPRDLLYCVQEELLSKFADLHEIGLMSSESFQVLESLKKRLEAVLAQQETSELYEEQLEVEALHNQVLALKERLGDPDTKYLKRSMISGKELALMEKVESLYKRLRDQYAQLKLARMQLRAFSSADEIIRELKADNSQLSSKVEYQSKLLQSLASDKSKHQVILSTLERLNNENRRLKEQLEGMSGLLGQIQLHLPADVRDIVRDLIEKNAALLVVFERNGVQLEDAFTQEKDGSEPALLEGIERLDEENTQLRTILETRRLIDNFVDELKKGREGNPNQIIEALEAENQRLEQALRDRENKISILSGDASNRPLLKALQRLRDENVRLLKENTHREQVCDHLKAEKKVRDLEYEALKKEQAELRSKYQAIVAQYRDVSGRFTKLVDEHNLLMKEYENLFKR